MTNLLLNPLTKKRLDSFVRRPSHALLLTGQEGSGLSAIADYVRKQFTQGAPDADALLLVEPNEKGTIAIETIRGLSKRLKLHNASEGVSIVTVIDGADTMPTEAQNSLLKLLEEPPKGVLFILLAYDVSKILTTISSRCINIQVLPVSLEQAKEYYTDTSADFIKTYYLSGGHAGLLHELITSDSHALVQAIQEAKELLAGTPYQRVMVVDSKYKKREAAQLIIKALLRISTAGLQSGRTSTRWIHNCRRSMHALRQLDANVQTKLVLDDLFLNLK